MTVSTGRPQTLRNFVFLHQGRSADQQITCFLLLAHINPPPLRQKAVWEGIEIGEKEKIMTKKFKKMEFDDAQELAKWILSLDQSRTRYIYLNSDVNNDNLLQFSEAEINETTLTDGSIVEDIYLK